MAASHDELHSEIQRLEELLEDDRRHTDLQFEAIRTDLRIVAEAVAALIVKVDRR